jgi:hypothetical protein
MVFNSTEYNSLKVAVMNNNTCAVAYYTLETKYSILSPICCFSYVHYCYLIALVFCVLCYYLVYIFVTSCVLFYCMCIAVLHTVVAGLLARSQYPEGPATGHLDTGFSWFPCV